MDPTEDLVQLVRLKTRMDRAKEEFDVALKRTVEQGVAYTTLGRLLGCTEGAVRLRAKREGWSHAGTARD